MSAYPPPEDRPYAAGQPPIIINNNVAATAVAGGYGMVMRRRQSLWVHFWLLMFTAGIGNVLYAVHVTNWNRKRGL